MNGRELLEVRERLDKLERQLDLLVGEVARLQQLTAKPAKAEKPQ